MMNNPQKKRKPRDGAGSAVVSETVTDGE